MNVGFYYHVDAVFEGEGRARVPSLLGLFVRELARRAGRVTLYAHGGQGTGIEDDVLGPPLVRCVDLGPRGSFPRRLLWPRAALSRFSPRRDGVDVMLVRGPTPMLPHLVRSAGVPVALHVVGDYADQRRDPAADSMPPWRRAAVRATQAAYTARQRRASRAALVVVNTPDLAGRFPGSPEVIFESTLPASAVADRARPGEPGLGRTRSARLLYTGRIAPEKGLWEAAEATALLAERGLDTTLGIAGWEDPGDRAGERLREHADALGVAGRIRFLGYVPAGEPLSRVYRAADVFVLATHGEGFPRALFEAMGAGLPVVTTPVGGIGHWLRDGEHAVLVRPRSAQALADGIAALLDDDALRERVASAGLAFAREHTLERGCALLAQRLAAYAGSGR